MTAKIRWQYEKIIGDRVYYARNSRSEIIVRCEKVGDNTKYAEYGYPKILGILVAVEQAHLEIPDEAIKP